MENEAVIEAYLGTRPEEQGDDRRMSGSDHGFGNRGNRDASIVNPAGRGTVDGSRRSGHARSGAEGTPFLIGENMRGGYGKADILHDCTLAVDKGQIAVIVGPNGAGKSTAMKAIFGMLDLREGRVVLDGQDITALNPQDRVRAGHGLRAADQQRLPLDDGRREPGNGRVHPRRDDFRQTMDQVYTLFPILARKAQPGRGRTVGRPAPAGRRGPRADDPAQAC